MRWDTDRDGLQDGTELGVTGSDVATDSVLSVHTRLFQAGVRAGFVADSDAGTSTDALMFDSDGPAACGVPDGWEDVNRDGAVSAGETDPLSVDDDTSVLLGVAPLDDTDGDGLCNGLEIALGSSPGDADTDDDGVSDYDEVMTAMTDPLLSDSDHDGIRDGTELGVTLADVTADPLLNRGAALGTDTALFVPDADPASTTNPRLADSDGGGVLDGFEDVDRDGSVDVGETDPSISSDG